MTAEEVVQRFIEVALQDALDQLPRHSDTRKAVRDRVAERLTKRSAQTPKRLSQQ